MSCIINLPGNRLNTKAIVTRETPVGARNGVNTHFTLAKKFVPGSLEVFLDAAWLNENDFTEGVDLQSFDLIINASESNRLNRPPRMSEEIRVKYLVAGESDCAIDL